MKCMTCGQELQKGMQFCFRCGATVCEDGEEYGAEDRLNDTVSESRQEISQARDPNESLPDAFQGDEAKEEGSIENEEAGSADKADRESPDESLSDASDAANEETLTDLRDTAEPSSEGITPSVPTPIPLTRLRSAIVENPDNPGEAQNVTGDRPAITFRDLRERLFDAGGSGLMLLLCILSTTQIVLSFFSGIVSFVTALAAAIKTGGRIGGEITLSMPSLFAIAGVVLLWILYTKCRKHTESGVSGILVALRVFMIVNAVSAAVGAAMVFLGAALYALIPAGMLFASRLGSVPPDGFPAWIFVAVEPILLFSTAVCILLAVYYGKAAVFFRDIRSVFTEKARPIRTGFLRFFCWLQIVTGALSALISMALFGSGKAVVRLLSSIPGLLLPPDAAGRIVTSVAVIAVVSAVFSLIAAVTYFVKERLFKAASDVTDGIFDSNRV